MNQAKKPDPVPILIVIPYWEGDRVLSGKMVGLISDLQTHHARREAEILLVCRQDSKIDLDMVSRLSEKFNIHTLRSFSPLKGWPQGCNGMFGSSMIHISQNMGTYGGVFWMESDCVPMRPSWYQDLSDAWRKRRPSTLVMGWMGDCNGDGTGVHITGCAIYHHKIARLMPQITKSCTMPWDYEHRNQIVSVGERTPLIENAYRQTVIDKNLLNLNFAVVHGYKNDGLISLVKEKYLTKP